MRKARQITGLLSAWRDGDAGAEDELFPLVYDELHRQAQRLMRSERAGHTIEPTALVHDVYMNLRGANVDLADRTHFYALCARSMRRLLINYANARAAQKRGGNELRVTWTERLDAPDSNDVELLELVDALDAFRDVAPEKAQLVELKYFGGLSTAEMEELTGMSSATIGRHLRFARAWMRDRMDGDRD